MASKAALNRSSGEIGIPSYSVSKGKAKRTSAGQMFSEVERVAYSEAHLQARSPSPRDSFVGSPVQSDDKGGTPLFRTRADCVVVRVTGPSEPKIGAAPLNPGQPEFTLKPLISSSRNREKEELQRQVNRGTQQLARRDSRVKECQSLGVIEQPRSQCGGCDVSVSVPAVRCYSGQADQEQRRRGSQCYPLHDVSGRKHEISCTSVVFSVYPGDRHEVRELPHKESHMRSTPSRR